MSSETEVLLDELTFTEGPGRLMATFEEASLLPALILPARRNER